jgi:hypothetical protein
MMKSRLLSQALCILSLFLIFGVAKASADCDDMSLGNVASLNGFLPYSGNPNNFWNQNILSAAIDPNSANIIAGLPINHHLHPDFGPDGGIPYVIVDSNSQPFINMNGPAAGPPGPNASQSDDVVEPAPLTAPIEGAQPDCLSFPATGVPQNELPEYNISAGAPGYPYYFGDTHLLVVDRAQCFVYETYLTTRCDGVYSVSGQAVWDLLNGEQRPWGWTSTDAAGDSVFVGLMKYDEVYAAANGGPPISHAVRFTVERTKGDNANGYFVLPDTHGAAPGYRYNSLNVMGMQLRLKNDTNTNNKIATYSAMNQAIFTGLQNYGMILADNGGDLFITGTTDSRWNTDDLGNWHGGPEPIEATDFDVIQMQVGVGAPDLNVEDAGSFPVDQTWSYMDANSAPYTVNDVEQGDYPGGLGPEGTSISGGGKYETFGPTGVTPGPAPSINYFQPYYDFLGIPIAPISCGSTIPAGTPIIFEYNITSAVPVIPSMGDFYSYIDNAGPVRVDNFPFTGDGYYTFTPTETQAYTLYSMNADGMSVSNSCTLYTWDSWLPVPVLSPSTGTYNTVISVQITEPGYPGATIYYTTDESIPAWGPGIPVGSTEQIYTAPIFITATSPDPVTYLPGEQINAIAVDSSLFAAPSGIGSAVYVVNSQAPAPVINPPSGTYNLPLAVTITEDPLFEPIDLNQDGDEAFVYYTTDGSTPGGDWFGDPTGTSQVCGSGVNAVNIYNNNGAPPVCATTPVNLIGGITTVCAVADAVGYTQSTVTCAVYNVPLTFTVTVSPATLTINPAGNAGSVSVTITSQNGYSGTVDLSCSGLPPGDACVFNPSSVSVTPSVNGLSVLTISAGLNAKNNSFPLLPGGATLAVALCFFGFRKRRRLQLIVLLAASVIGLSLFTGCGTPGSVPNSVSVVITGTDSNGAPVVNSNLQVIQMQSQ